MTHEDAVAALKASGERVVLVLVPGPRHGQPSPRTSRANTRKLFRILTHCLYTKIMAEKTMERLSILSDFFTYVKFIYHTNSIYISICLYTLKFLQNRRFSHRNSICQFKLKNKYITINIFYFSYIPTKIK